MEQSKIIKYIKELSPKSRERFRQFVISPYFNQHEQTIKLVEIILKALNRPVLKLDRQKIFQRLFPGKAYNEQKIHNVLSYIKKLYVRFLAYEQMEHFPFMEQILSLEASYERNQFDLLVNRGKYLEKQLKKHPIQNSNYHYSQYRLNYILGYYYTIYVTRAQNERFQYMLDHLDRYYMIEKLRNCCHLTANMILMPTHYELHLLEALLSFIRKNKKLFLEDYSIKLYYTILMNLRHEDKPEYYLQLKDLLTDHFDRLSSEEQTDLYTFSYNHCIQKINLGHQEYQEELFQLYKQGLTGGLLLQNGLLHEFNYKNITTLGCALREYEWTEKFIHGYREKLPDNQRENAYNYNLANLYFHKKMYNEAIPHLQAVEFTDVKYHLSYSSLMLKTYYELGDTVALLSLIEAFRIYSLRNRSITQDQKRAYTNFLRFARRLVLLKHQSYTYSPENLQAKLKKLHTQIEQTENVFNKNWLMKESQLETEPSAP